MHVVMIGPFPENPSFISGGVQASVYGLARALLKQDAVDGVSVFSIPVKVTNDGIRTNTIEGLDVTYLDAPYKYQASAAIHVPRVLRQIRAHAHPVAHIHGTGLFQAMLSAWLRMKRVPFVWTLHGIISKENLQRYRNKPGISSFIRYIVYTGIERFQLKISREIIVDTPYVEVEVRLNTKSNIHVIPQGIFAGEFTALQPASQASLFVLSVGVFSPRKGHLLTLDAFAHVLKKVPAARLIIAGAPTHPGYYESLQIRAKDLGIESSVEFAVNRPRSEIIALLGKARVFALHSQEESQGIALCEALAAGLPIVATSVGGIPYVVADGKDGFLVPYGDVIAFSDHIARLLADEALHAQMSTHARIAARRFDWDTIAANVIKIYRGQAF